MAIIFTGDNRGLRICWAPNTPPSPAFHRIALIANEIPAPPIYSDTSIDLPTNKSHLYE